jgi:SAM-dependent methyltransferase
MDSVREQYESLPYPARDPADERKRLLRTWLDDLPMINHYGFAGRQSFGRDFRVLVAGGGTGDATIFLAEQLRGTDAQVVHLDLSDASLAIARKRAEVRGLTNIRFMRESLLNLPRLGLGKFDYVNCVGVLHHLEDPDAGLRALLDVLADDGALGIMVYARYGRTGVYQAQDLMKLVNDAGLDRDARIANTRQMLGALPKSNWFKRGEDLYNDHRHGDAGLYDLLLHSRDRAYTVGELHEWLADGHGLHLELTDVNAGRSAYLPAMLMGPKPPAVLESIRKMPERRQHEIAELFSGRIQTHSFFATRAPRCAPYGDASYIPFFFHEPVTGPQLAAIFERAGGRPFVLDHAHTGLSLVLDPGRHAPEILRHMDGERSFRKIFDRVRDDRHVDESELSDAALFADFRATYETFNALDRILLRADGSQ